MINRISALSVGVWAACMMLAVSGGCGGPGGLPGYGYARLDPAERLLTIEADGPAASGAIQTLIEALQAKNPVYRAQAAQILGTWAAVSSNPGFVAPAVKSEDPLVRCLVQAAYIEHSPDSLGVLVVEGNIVEVPPAVLKALAEAGDSQGFVSPAEAITPLLDRMRPGLYGTTEQQVLTADILARVHDAGARRVLINLVDTGEGKVLAKAARACSRDDMDLGTTLLPLAFSGGVLGRRAAMEALVLRPNPWLKELVVKGMKDSDDVVRHNAIRAAGNLDGAAPMEALAARLSAPGTEGKMDVIQALGGVGERAAGVLRGYIRGGPPTPMLRVVALMSFSPYATRDDIPWVAALLKSDNKHIRAAALAVLGRIGNPEAQAAILSMAKDKEPVVRAMTAKALGQLRTIYGSIQLVKMLSDEEALVRSWAAWGLGNTGYVDSVPALITLAKAPVAPSSTPARFDELYGWPEASAIEALGKIGGPKAALALRELMSSKSWLVRAAAAHALGASGDQSPETAKALEAHREDPVNLVKAEVFLSLKTLGKAALPK
jgi:HEAT repeat protein